MKSRKKQKGFFDGFSSLVSLGSSLIGGFLTSEGQDDANVANAYQAQTNRDFQERMSNTAYQRSTKDMIAAGLNPMLAYSQGGASTPTGGVGNPIINKQGAGVEASQKSLTSAAQAQQAFAQTDLLRTTVDKTKAETDNIKTGS